MYSTITSLLNRLDSPASAGSGIIGWGCPVPSFGDADKSVVATLGLNPSNREFVDEAGKELVGGARRFHTLQSLRLTRWAEADARHIELITESCATYFTRSPYRVWFRKLEDLLAAAGASFYGKQRPACHLDLIPFATAAKWNLLTARQRSSLLAISKDCLARVLRQSRVRVLILNGRSVVEYFQSVSGVRVQPREEPGWSLRRSTGRDVVGIAYKAITSIFSGMEIGREVLVLGFNHNLQSSYGVTSEAMTAIRQWVAKSAAEILP